MATNEEEDEVVLHAFLHPTMELPFAWDMRFPLRFRKTARIGDLMERLEQMFSQVAAQKGEDLKLQINVAWNTKEAKRALNPKEEIGKHFQTGDLVGIYGDIGPAGTPNNIPESQKVPVTILTGFLGAGKTTLLNYILQEQSDKKIAIIENEFGEVSIDDALINNQKQTLAEKVVLMDNGCMCCTIRGDLVNGLKQILDEIHKGSTIDAIMIETTGMADPVPIVRTFMSTLEITQELRLDGVLCVCDSKHLDARLNDDVEEGKVNEAYQQVAFSDKILLNKIDLVSTDEAIAIKDKIRSINAFAKVIPTVKGRVNLTELSNMRAHDLVNFVNDAIDQEAETAPELRQGHGHDQHEDGHGDGHGHDHGHDPDCNEDHGHGKGHHADAVEGHGHGHVAKKSRHDSRVNSFSMVREGEIVPQKLSHWMSSLGQLPKEKGVIFRIKAILAVQGHPYKHVFHAVMDVSDEDDAEAWADGEKKISKIVFIGKSLDEKFLRDGFEAIFAK